MTKINVSLMLFYHGRGIRDYVGRPHPMSRRVHWEWAAIIAGAAYPTLENGHKQNHDKALWIFPPRHPHGWAGPPGSSCQVCIAHLATAPRLIANAVDAQGFLRISLSDADCSRIAETDQRVARLLSKRPDAGETAADLLRGVLASIAIATLPKQPSPMAEHERLVKQLLAWYDEQLHLGITVTDACRHFGYSAAHLRRLCHASAGRSPRELLAEARIDRAKTLLRQADLTLEAIAQACGFASAVALSQAFLRQTGKRPGAWRRGPSS